MTGVGLKLCLRNTLKGIHDGCGEHHIVGITLGIVHEGQQVAVMQGHAAAYVLAGHCECDEGTSVEDEAAGFFKG